MPWLLWRLVKEKIATLQEIETHWSLEDVVIGNIVIDCQELAEWKLSQRK